MSPVGSCLRLFVDISGRASCLVARDSQFNVPHLDLLCVQVYS